MGCDIHLYKEKKVDGIWITADEGWCDEYDEGCLDVPYENRFTNRDYDLFGFLAGVRREPKYSFKARGLPFNICKEVKAVSDDWDSDGHSYSYLYVSELKDAVNFLESETVTVSGMKDKESMADLKKSINSDKPTDWNLLYPYCGWASDALKYEEFSIEVPASFMLGAIKDIASTLESVGGDDQRIVFWFDN